MDNMNISSLLRPETHIDLLDDFGGLDNLIKDFREVVQWT